MSGTSADSVDAALVRIGRDPGDVELVAFRGEPIEDALRERIHALATAKVDLRALVQLDVALGERFAAAAVGVAREAGVPLGEIRGIASHGQTVGHYPEREVRGTLQLGAAAV